MEFVDKAYKITEIQRADHPVKDVVVLFGGDMVEGLFNYPAQLHEVDATLFEQYVTVSRLITDVIRKALAIGATDAVRINAVPTDAYFVAEQIATYAKAENFDLIFTGRESIDYNGGQVCGLLAEMLGLPSVNVITSIEIDGTTATMERDIDGGREKVSANLPLVVSAQKELTEPRIPNMRGIMAARTKPLKVIEPASTELTSSAVGFELPAKLTTHLNQVVELTFTVAVVGLKFL
jgi:electron transfer flavoprotein alpha/beta subunit